MRPGRVEVIEADLSGYFDSIPQGKRLKKVARRISDGAILKRIKGWLRAPTVEPKGGGAGGQGGSSTNRCGTPPGGVISPRLANAYLNPLDWEGNERGELKPGRVRYADDLVILSRPGEGKELMERLKGGRDRRGRVLNQTQTRRGDIRPEGIQFLGFALTWRRGRSGRNYPPVEAHPKSLKKLRDGLREKLNRGTLWRPVAEVLPELHRKLKGGAGYFHQGNSNKVMSPVDWQVCGKLQRWRWRKHGGTSGWWSTYKAEELQERFQLYRLPGPAERKRNG